MLNDLPNVIKTNITAADFSIFAFLIFSPRVTTPVNACAQQILIFVLFRRNKNK